MSELSTFVKKWTNQVETWWKGVAPGLEADFTALAKSFQTQVGPLILAAAEQALTDIGEAALGTINPATLIAQIETDGKTLLTAIQTTAINLAKQGVTTTTGQIIGALAVVSNNMATAAASTATTTAAPLSGAAQAAENAIAGTGVATS
jgi:hypothetical protein